MESSCVSPRSVTLLTASVEKRARARAHSRGHSHTLARTGRSAECSDPLGHTRLCGRSVLIPATSEAVC